MISERLEKIEKVRQESLKYFTKIYNLYISELFPLFKKDFTLVTLRNELYLASEYTKFVFKNTGSFKFCARCGRETGGCCQIGLEWQIKPEEFLINLWLFSDEEKVNFQLERTFPDKCLFLGFNGCKLITPPVFCRNFFCEELKDFLGEEKLKLIQKEMGKESELLFKACEHIINNYESYILKISDYKKEQK